MTHPSGLIREAVELGAAGRTPADIARLLDVHRSTVRCWLDGRTPSRWRPDPEATCPTCEGGAHAFSELPPVYVHLLGLYLGDGCLSAHPRGVFKLRIVLDTAYPQIIAECEQSIRAVAPDGSIRRCAKQGCAEVFYV